MRGFWSLKSNAILTVLWQNKTCCLGLIFIVAGVEYDGYGQICMWE